MIKYINGIIANEAFNKLMEITSFNQFIDKLIKCGFDQKHNQFELLSKYNVVFKKNMTVKFVEEYDIIYTILIRFCTIRDTDIVSSINIEVNTGLENSVDFINLAGYDISMNITCLKLIHQLDVYLIATKNK